MSQVVGVDGSRKKWVTVVLKGGRFAECRLFATLAEILAAYPDAEAFGIDVPIGFPDATGDAVRAADRASRDFVGPRRSSVFPMPPRDVLEAESYPEANALSRRRYGRGLSAQSYALRKNIFEADAIATEPNVFEVHPEVSFRALKGDVLTHTKKSWNGMRERVRLLEGAGIMLPDELPGGRAPVDDVFDAAVAAWSAGRIARGVAGVLPEAVGEALTEAGGGTPRIWY